MWIVKSTHDGGVSCWEPHSEKAQAEARAAELTAQGRWAEVAEDAGMVKNEPEAEAAPQAPSPQPEE